LGSGFAGTAVAYARTRAYPKKVNGKVFGRKGLSPKVLSTDKIAIDAPEKKLKLAPLPDYGEAWDPASPDLYLRMRRMKALGGRVAILDWDVKKQDMPTNWLRKLGAWQSQRAKAKRANRHDQAVRKMNKGHVGTNTPGTILDNEQER